MFQLFCLVLFVKYDKFENKWQTFSHLRLASIVRHMLINMLKLYAFAL